MTCSFQSRLQFPLAFCVYLPVICLSIFLFSKHSEFSCCRYKTQNYICFVIQSKNLYFFIENEIILFTFNVMKGMFTLSSAILLYVRFLLFNFVKFLHSGLFFKIYFCACVFSMFMVFILFLVTFISLEITAFSHYYRLYLLVC